MDTIILAAGQSLYLDGYHKLLIRHPQTEESILDQYLRFFKETDITVVVGYKALEIMNAYPNLNYIYNEEWASQSSSGSLALALANRPTYILSSDFFLSSKTISRLKAETKNAMLTSVRESRSLNAINCTLDENHKVLSIYKGLVKNVLDPESLGIFKLTSIETIRTLKKQCIRFPNLFVAENLQLNESETFGIDVTNSDYVEINTVHDYMRLLNEHK